MADTSKDTLYIDVDDEITTIIDKVASSDKKLVALVLPKRASVFQSIVNMKLLKRKSSEAGKKLVLVTTEASLLPLAGAVGLHVAKTLASKPEIPDAPVLNTAPIEADEDETISLEPEAESEPELQSIANEPIGKLAGEPDNKDIETIELDNSDESTEEEGAAAAAAASESKPKTPKNKKLRVPNFERFRLYIILGIVGIVILVFLWILLFSVLPHATIDIQTNAQNVNASVSLNLSTTATSLDQSTDTVPAKQVSENKTATATVNATGQQNNGQKSTGSVNLTAVECNTFTTPNSLPAGSGVVQGNLTYITQQDATFTGSPTYNSHTHCFSYPADNAVDITAQNGGKSYNTGNTSFNVPGRGDVTGSGSASGGTDDIITIVSSTDITSAESKITSSSSVAKQDLLSQLNQAGYYPINATFAAGTPTNTPNATAGTAASSVTVTQTVAYTMYGAHQQDLSTLLNTSVASQVGSNQNIIDNGLSGASFTVGSTPTSLTMATTAEVGPNIVVGDIKKQATGKKSGDIVSAIKSDPNVTNVTVHFSPFYVSSAPGASKITVHIAKPTKSP